MDQGRVLRLVAAVGVAMLVAASPMPVPVPVAAASQAAPAALGLRAVDVMQISSDRLPSPPPSEPDTQVEPTLAQDSNAPDHLVAVFQEGRYPDGAAAAAGFAASRDDGKAWTRGELPGLTMLAHGPFERAGDQVAAFGPGGI